MTREDLQTMEIKTVGVLGAGTMGSGIAQVAAQAGLQVVMRDIDERFVNGGLGAIDRFLTRSVEKQKITVKRSENRGEAGRTSPVE